MSRVTLVVVFYVTDSTQYLSILVGIIPISHDEIIYEQTNLLHGAYQSDLRSDSSHLTAAPWMRPCFSKRSVFLLNSSARFRNQRASYGKFYNLMRKILRIFRKSRWIRCCSLWRYWWWMRVATPHVHSHQSDSPMVYLTVFSVTIVASPCGNHILVWMNILPCLTYVDIVKTDSNHVVQFSIQLLPGKWFVHLTDMISCLFYQHVLCRDKLLRYQALSTVLSFSHMNTLVGYAKKLDPRSSFKNTRKTPQTWPIAWSNMAPHVWAIPKYGEGSNSMDTMMCAPSDVAGPSRNWKGGNRPSMMAELPPYFLTMIAHY